VALGKPKDVTIAKPCSNCQVQPVWNRWPDRCFLCASVSLFSVCLRPVYWVAKAIIEREGCYGAVEKPDPPKLPVAKVRKL
jgi:hypothetical protein